jgi:hypothetical protein
VIDFQERKEKIAERAIELMQERSGQYSHTGEDHIHAKIMLLLFPDGIKGTFSHFARYKELSFIVEKICRYTANFNEEDYGHEDSVMDLICFGVMLAALDQQLREKKDAMK